MIIKKISVLQLNSGKEPFQRWFKKLEKKVQAIITSYIHRISCGGSQKNIKSLGDGVYEIKIYHTSGYRIYFGETRQAIVLILGGNKNTQSRDINLARRYWRAYEKK